MGGIRLPSLTPPSFPPGEEGGSQATPSRVLLLPSPPHSRVCLDPLQLRPGTDEEDGGVQALPGSPRLRAAARLPLRRLRPRLGPPLPRRARLERRLGRVQLAPSPHHHGLRVRPRDRLPWTWKCSKVLMKLIHAGLNTVALTLAIISLVAVFDFHNAKKIPNMYSLHSWIGLTAVILYALQLVLGFMVFLLPFASTSLRATVMPIHVYSGLLIFGTVIATALMGITEKLIFTLKSPSYSSSPEEAIFVNVLGVLIFAYGAVILWMATRPHWKRPLEQVFQAHQRIGETLSDDDCQSPDVEFSSDAAARKRNPKFDEAGQRSTM
ncbi:plasma membrane ascorbate-dependent reductase CYBRD1 isoform 1-T1 [Liasis olivaceus]